MDYKSVLSLSTEIECSADFGLMSTQLMTNLFETL